MTKVQELADKIISGDRRALSRAITLVESSRQDHREEALELTAILTASGRQATRIGLSGTPGVGKSTFIESFGSFLTWLNLRVAVLAVDPSSVRTGGSILGDKTRMDRLSRDANAFIRPSPSQSHLGGVARHTRDVVTICEAAGFDVVMILLLAPAGGDELQGVKRGIMEMADIILVNKADGDLKHAAMRTCADFSGALRLLRHRPQDLDGFPKVIPVSAVQEMGLSDTWEAMNDLLNWRKAEGHFDDNRSRQAGFWFEEDVKQGVLARLREKDVQEMMTKFAIEVKAGNLLPGQAARAVIRRIEELK
jgi:LAO/AO transport system kinase